MKKIITILLSFCSLLGVTAYGAENNHPNSAPEKTIGIVLPLEHVALREIVSGFEEAVTKNYPGKIRFEVQNAEHDLNLQHAILQKFINQKVDMIVPVATATTQMAIAMIKTQPIIGLAAMIPDSARAQNELAAHFTAVQDEISSEKQISFIHGILPTAKKITLIHSADDKVMPEVQAAMSAAKSLGIKVQLLMIQNLSDLYAISRRIDQDSQAIFILKDNLVASGINTLISQANKRHIPLITSDEGTVSGGAATALGVAERQIGIQGGELAAKILHGESMRNMPVQSIKNLQIFINNKAAAAQGINIPAIQNYAKQQNYMVVELKSSTS